MEKEFIETLKKDYWGECFGRIWYMWLERLFFDRGLKAQFKELSEREKEQAILIKNKLKKYNVDIEDRPILPFFAFVLALFSFLIPKALFLRVNMGFFKKFIDVLKDQEKRFGLANPELFRGLVKHEEYQYECFKRILLNTK
jgi:hypothetical protein